MKKKKILAVIVLICTMIAIGRPIAILYVLNNGNPYTKYMVNQHVPMHLEKQGYVEEDFIEAHYVTPKHLVNSEFYHLHYMVIFIDEPQLTYYYGLKKWSKDVDQFCQRDILSEDGITSTFEGESNHLEKQCANYY